MLVAADTVSLVFFFFPCLQMGTKVVTNAQVDRNSTLILRPLTKEQHGMWECVANNGVARVSIITSVYVLGECFVPRAVALTGSGPVVA